MSASKYDLDDIESTPILSSTSTSPYSINSTRYYDLVWLIIYMLGYVVTVVISYYNIYTNSKISWYHIHTMVENSSSNKNIKLLEYTINSIDILLTLLCTYLFSCILSICIILLCKKYPKFTIWFSTIFVNIIFYILGIYCVYIKHYFFGVVFLILAIVFTIVLSCIGKSLDFTIMLLNLGSNLILQNYSIIILSTLCIPVALLLISPAAEIVIWSLVALYLRDLSLVGTALGLLFFGLLMLFWTINVVRNILHMTISGAAATVCFHGKNIVGMNKSIIYSPLYRACTLNVGSICFGSLILSLVETLDKFIEIIMKMSGENEITIFIHKCLCGCIEDLIEMFNFWVYIVLAVEGGDYCSAAKKSTWAIWSHGLHMITHQAFVGYVVFMGSVVGALIIAGFSAFYIYFGTTAHNYSLIILASFFALLICITTVGSLISVVNTIFYCMAYYPVSTANYVRNYMDRCDSIYSSAAETLLNSGIEIQHDYANPDSTNFRAGNFHSH